MFSKGQKSIKELNAEFQLKMGSMIKQKIWPGWPCSSTKNNASLTKSSGGLSFAHWSKGPLVWTSNFTSQSSNKIIIE